MRIVLAGRDAVEAIVAGPIVNQRRFFGLPFLRKMNYKTQIFIERFGNREKISYLCRYKHKAFCVSHGDRMTR